VFAGRFGVILEASFNMATLKATGRSLASLLLGDRSPSLPCLHHGHHNIACKVFYSRMAHLYQGLRVGLQLERQEHVF
jgi:hypothetical protein